MIELNIPQMNRQLLMLQHAERENNWLDDDQVVIAMDDLRKSETLEEATDAMNYLITCVEYRKGKECQTLRTLRDEFKAFISLLNAVSLKNQEAIDWWNKEAEKGTVMRIM